MNKPLSKKKLLARLAFLEGQRKAYGDLLVLAEEKALELQEEVERLKNLLCRVNKDIRQERDSGAYVMFDYLDEFEAKQ